MTAFLTHPFWIWLTVVAVVLGFVACVSFVARFLYTSGRDAWRNPFGKYLIVRKGLLGTLFALILMNATLGEWTGRRPVTAVLMLAFALHTFVPYRLLMDAQRAHTEKEKAQP